MTDNTGSAEGGANQVHELWQLLIEKGGLAPDGYDSPIVDDLRQRLSLPSNQPIIETLERAQLSTNAFVEAFFQCAQPYVRMWAELLSMYERAAANQGDNNLTIRYNFDEPSGLENLEFDLESFRQVVRAVELLMAPFDLSAIEPGDFWMLAEPFRDSDGSYRSDPPMRNNAFREFVAECRDGSYPSTTPNLPTVGDQRIERLLQETWSLVDIVRGDLQDQFVSYRALDEMLDIDDEPLSYGLSKHVLHSTEHDHWLPTFVSSVLGKYEEREAHDWSSIADQLDTALGKFRNQDVSRRTPMERLEEFLQLPLWRFRHDLYSHWVCAAVIKSLDDQNPIIHASNGILLFSFTGTHLATFDALKPRVHLWTELRTPLENPVGKGRTSHIQPDITLRRDPLTAGLNPVVVECKQYKRAKNKEFGAALTDYARGHQDALIILADYGRVSPRSVLRHVPQDLHERTAVVSDLHPAHKESVETFQTYLRKGLQLGPLVPNGATVGGRMELTWGAEPRDLDLHLFMDYPEHHVAYNNQGALEKEPFAYLENDDRAGHGHEVIRIAHWLPTRYQVEVHRYSDEAPLAESSAVVTLEVGGDTYQYTCPNEIEDVVWRVCAIDGATLTVEPL